MASQPSPKRPTDRDLYGFIWDDPNPEAPDAEQRSMWEDEDFLRNSRKEEE